MRFQAHRVTNCIIFTAVRMPALPAGYSSARPDPMRRMLLLLALLHAALPAYLAAQTNDTRHELVRDMPTYYDQLLTRLTYPLAWPDCGMRFGRWRREARNELMRCLQPIPPRTDFRPEVVATERRDGYEARRLTFQVSAWARIPAYLLVPDGEGPHPAVLLLHDHGAKFSIGKEKMVRPFGVDDSIRTDAEEWSRKCYDGLFVGDELARRGYVVLAADALFWGERGRKEGIRYDSQQALAANLMQLGLTWSALITADDMACADFLATLPEVDSRRIGCFGFSMGAYRSWMLAAATDRIRCAASLCWMGTTEALTRPGGNQGKGGSAYAMLVPGLRNAMDYPHVASIACPKPMLFFNGRRDKLFPVDGVETSYRILREVWEKRKAGDRLVARLWEEKHFCSRAMLEEVEAFFRTYLKHAGQ